MMAMRETAKRLERGGLLLTKSGAKPSRSKRFAIPKNLIDIQYQGVRRQNHKSPHSTQIGIYRFPFIFLT
jgi:hypothetical protein